MSRPKPPLPDPPGPEPGWKLKMTKVDTKTSTVTNDTYRGN